MTGGPQVDRRLVLAAGAALLVPAHGPSHGSAAATDGGARRRRMLLLQATRQSLSLTGG